MAGFEDVIQRALEKQDSSSASVREQVYDSARATLANMLNSSGNLSPENIRDQQQRLELAISGIESQYIARDEVYPDVNPVNFDQGVVAPPPVQELLPDEVNAQPERSLLRRRPFSILLLTTIVLVAVGMGSWWVYDQELTKPAELRDNSVPNPPKILADESFQPASNGNSEGEWLTIFSPGDPRGLVTLEGSTAELGKDNNGAYARLSDRANDPTGGFQLVVEPGVMETMRGKTATFEITAKSGNGGTLQFVITCQFGSASDCGRRRFTADATPQSFVFETAIDASPVTGVSKIGTISLIADVTGKARPLDLYRFRINVR